MKMFLYTDGGARGNPGPAAIALVLKDEKNIIIKETSKYIGEATNNEAEYQALIAGLEAALDKEATKLVSNLDSLLLVKQLNGNYKVKNPRMRKYWRQAKELEKKLESIEYIHIPREDNFEADSLVNEVLDSLP